MAVHYPEHIVHTRTASRVLSIFLVAMLTPFLLRASIGSQPGRIAGLILLTISPFLISNRCLHFLAKQELQHASPTPEMSFVFGLAISVPLANAAAALIILST